MLTVVYLSILQHKMVFFMSHGNFTNIFSVSVVTRDEVKWFRDIVTAFTVSPQYFNIISSDRPLLISPPLSAPSHVAA
jgi:hypothetical protein